MCLSENTQDIKNKCTITIQDNFNKNKIQIKNYKIIDNKRLEIPRSICKDCTHVSNGEKISTEFKTDLKMFKDQEKIVESIPMKGICDKIIVRPTAYGKTFLSLNIINKLKVKTIIIVNRTELVNQWVKVLKESFPNNTVGKIQGKSFDIHCDIITSTVQTLALKDDITSDMLDSIGLVIIDEIHTIPSERFINILFKLKARVRLGLTATLERQDMKEKVLLQHLQDVDEIQKVKKQQTTTIRFINSGYYMAVEYLFKDRMNYSEMLRKLVEDSDRNLLVLGIIKDLLKNSHKEILVMSDRISQLTYFYNNLPEELAELCISSNKKKTFTKRVTLGTTSIVSTGMNIPRLNTLLIASPKKNIVQTIGRIFRKIHTEVPPEIVDIVDLGLVPQNQMKKRKQQYKQEIKDILFVSDKKEINKEKSPDVEFLE